MPAKLQGPGRNIKSHPDFNFPFALSRVFCMFAYQNRPLYLKPHGKQISLHGQSSF